MSRSAPRPNYIGDMPNIGGVVHVVDNWYPEWQLVKMGEADNTPGDPFDVPWDKEHED